MRLVEWEGSEVGKEALGRRRGFDFGEETVFEVEHETVLTGIAGEDCEFSKRGVTVSFLLFDNDDGGGVSSPSAAASNPGSWFFISVPFFGLRRMDGADQSDVTFFAEDLEFAEPRAYDTLIVDFAFRSFDLDSFDDDEFGLGSFSEKCTEVG